MGERERAAMKKYLAKNWRLVLAGILLTAFAVPCAYEARGHWAIGGEWLILPAVLMAAHLAMAIMQDVLEIISFEDGDEE